MTTPEALEFAAADYLELQSIGASREIRETARLRFVHFARIASGACTAPASTCHPGLANATPTTGSAP